MDLRNVACAGVLGLAAWSTGAWMGCSTEAGDAAALGTAQAAITNVPGDGSVACIAITSTGSWSTTQSFDVFPGESTVFTLNGIPTGTVRFDSSAYPTACAQVSPSSTATWVSIPVLATVTAGQMTMVSLSLQQAGSSTVGVDFMPPPACRNNGLPCLSGGECCSGTCGANNTCAPGQAMCAPPGAPCMGPSDCCNGLCDPTFHCAVQTGCMLPSDCPGIDTECAKRACNGGACGMVFAPSGAPTVWQTAGDCTRNVCDGMGGIIGLGDPTDLPNDGNACTLDLCLGGQVPGFIPTPAGTSCAQSGGTVCDGNGACVQCLTSADCAGGAGVCFGNVCVGSSCSDGLKDGMETDVDCGGSVCPSCAIGKHCVASVDCVGGGACFLGVCSAPSCSDGLKDGTETDVDCGGPVCLACPTGKQCQVAADCVSQLCFAGICN